MAKVVTITDIEFTEACLSRDENGEIYVSVGYRFVPTTLRGERTIQLAGARKTSVVNFFANLKTDILALEGI